MIEKLLFFGDIAWGTQCLQRFDAIREDVAHAYGVDTRMFLGDGFSRDPWAKIQMRAGIGPVIKTTSTGLLREVARYRPQVVWVESGLCLNEEAITEAKGRYSTVFVHFTADSLLAPGWNNRCFPKTLPHYDLCMGIKARERELYRSERSPEAAGCSQGIRSSHQQACGTWSGRLTGTIAISPLLGKEWRLGLVR